MSRFFVAPNRVAAEALCAELDVRLGLRKPDGTAVSVPSRIFYHGVEVTGTALDPQTRGVKMGATRATVEPLEADDGTCAVWIPEQPAFAAHLGKGGVPRANQLVSEEALPAKLKDALQRQRGHQELEALAFGNKP